MLVSDAGNVDDGACPSDYGTGEVPERYRVRRLVREQDGPVTVLRCHVPSGHGKSYRVRMWAFFAFTLAAASAGIVVPRPDVVIATSPPLVAGIPGWLVAKLRLHRVPWTFEIRDLWPESTVRAGVLRKDSLLTKALYVLERGACKSADRANVLTPAFREDLVGRGLATAEKVIFVPKGADVSLFKPGPRDNAVRREFAWGDRFTVMYSGAHGRANAVGQRVEAADRLRDRSDILLATVGDGSERGRGRGRGQKARPEQYCLLHCPTEAPHARLCSGLRRRRCRAAERPDLSNGRPE
jgi:glycosyltransferase involved in cell wall biosynthesis